MKHYPRRILSRRCAALIPYARNAGPLLTRNGGKPRRFPHVSLKSLDHKFITEDVPTGLIPMSALGRAAGVGTPAIDALVELGRKMTGKDFAAERTKEFDFGPPRRVFLLYQKGRDSRIFQAQDRAIDDFT